MALREFGDPGARDRLIALRAFVVCQTFHTTYPQYRIGVKVLSFVVRNYYCHEGTKSRRYLLTYQSPFAILRLLGSPSLSLVTHHSLQVFIEMNFQKVTTSTGPQHFIGRIYFLTVFIPFVSDFFRNPIGKKIELILGKRL